MNYIKLFCSLILVTTIFLTSCKKDKDNFIESPNVKLEMIPSDGENEEVTPTGLSDEDMITAQDQLNSHINMTYVTNDLISSEEIENISDERTKIYKWKILQNAYGWNIVSYEKGKHKKVLNDPSGVGWKWVSLEHQSIQIEGFTPLVNVSPSLISANSTIGLHHSIMDINFNVTFSLMFKGFPITSSHNYVATKILFVND